MNAVDRLTMTAEFDDAGHAVLRAVGILDAQTYRHARDSMIKAALTGPPAVIVDVTNLEVPAASALASFTSARWHVGQWPDVPIAVACPDRELRRVFVKQGVGHYVPVFATEAEAAATIGTTRYRRRARLSLSRDEFALSRTHAFICDQLSTWSMPDRLLAVSTVGRALVDNAVTHTLGDLAVRLETDGDVVTVAVSDDSSTPAARQEHDTRPHERVRGLDLVDALCRTWRNSPTGDGKTVWALMGPENGLADVAGLIADRS